VHGDVVDQFLEVFGARHEIAFAVDLDQHANLAAGVNVVAHGTFAGDARRFLGCDRNALFSQHDDRLLQVAFGFGQGLFAIHHRCSGFFAELFYLGSRNICHSRGAHSEFFLQLKLAVIKLDPRTDKLREV
jgi:hypothetical protein